MQGLDTFAAFAATYDSLDAAETDYDAIKSLYYDEHILDTFDAAVISKDDKGKVKIVKKHEQPLRQGAWVGGGHAAGGMSRSDLKDLGETLDSGQAAVVAVAAAAIADRVAESLKNADKVDRKELKADPKRGPGRRRHCRLDQLTVRLPGTRGSPRPPGERGIRSGTAYRQCMTPTRSAASMPCADHQPEAVPVPRFVLVDRGLVVRGCLLMPGHVTARPADPGGCAGLWPRYGSRSMNG